MRYIVLLLVPFALAAQPAEPDSRVTQALIKEMQQLRLAIERSTLLGARTQLAVSQLQLQDTAVARLKQQYDEVRTNGASINVRRTQFAEEVKDLEQRRTTPEFSNPQKLEMLDSQLKQMKYEMDRSTAEEQIRLAREGDLAVQLQAAQAQIAESRSRIAEMEKALDTAIQQLLKEK